MDEHTATEIAYKNGYEQGWMDAVRWIPVTERLPIPYMNVLTYRSVAISNGVYIIAIDKLLPHPDGSFVWGKDLDTWKSKATHWMPLPEPPKEGK